VEAIMKERMEVKIETRIRINHEYILEGLT
jgi:hypothetical protein